ncbi:hypothetical protein FB45DRAFT_932305 [Roridomyces roridus]|uniref:MYND-type domain-containing protein n=1 Tax=Roridomyces roridus TaxID=1738132 RepID=A0AAD7BF85_9AGAR|nr:hypothetical protein FB45DRAFT_932305 [Roridomyces roridus]
MGFGDSPKSPSFEVDRRGWNAAWERDLATIYGSGIPISYPNRRPIPSITSGLPPQHYEMMLAEGNTANLQNMARQICVLQRDLTKSLLSDLQRMISRRGGLGGVCKDREDLILEALVRACRASPDFEEHRKCPELTLKRLNNDSGKGYIDLVKKLCHNDLERVPSDFKTVPNTVYDQLTAAGRNAHPGELLAKKSLDASRTYLLTMVVWNVLLAYYGESERYGLDKGQRGTMEENKSMKEAFRADLGSKAMKSAMSEVSANRENAEHHCTSCNLPASKLGLTTLSACQRCKAIDRLVYYCSKQCQTTDWKTGTPPHKTVCGKKGAVATALLSPVAAAEDDDDDLYGPPVDGYTRSPALLHQLKLLQRKPGDHGVMLQDPMGKLFFKTGAPSEVLMMYNLLEPTAKNAVGFGVDKLRAQLLKEYGVDVEEVRKAKEAEKAK